MLIFIHFLIEEMEGNSVWRRRDDILSFDSTESVHVNEDRSNTIGGSCLTEEPVV